RLLNPEKCFRRCGSRTGKTDSHRASLHIQFDCIERTRIQRQPEAHWSEVDALADSIERLQFDPVTILLEVASKYLPAKLRMLDQVSGSVHSNAKEVWTVVAGVCIPPHVLRERVKGR